MRARFAAVGAAYSSLPRLAGAEDLVVAPPVEFLAPGVYIPPLKFEDDPAGDVPAAEFRVDAGCVRCASRRRLSFASTAARTRISISLAISCCTCQSR